MRSASSTSSYASGASVALPAQVESPSRLADYLELSKPRIAVMALITVTVGFVLGSEGTWRVWPLVHALGGITLVAVASSALNQYLERVTDGRMLRTAARPLPSGRMQPLEVLCFGAVTGLAGVLYLAVQVNLLTAGLGLLTLVLYVGVYTPMKRISSVCTLIGAVPGALPPVLGWVAASNSIDAGAFSLFAILFVWQFPHFLAIAWLYQDQYAGAGLRMLPAARPAPRITGFMCVAYALALLPVSLLPAHVALAGSMYSATALVLGLGYLLCAVRFLHDETALTARGLIYSSLLYLPTLLLVLTADHLRLLQ